MSVCAKRKGGGGGGVKNLGGWRQLETGADVERNWSSNNDFTIIITSTTITIVTLSY